MTTLQEWLDFSRKLVDAGHWLANAAMKHLPSSLTDPKLVALLLLPRTLSHVESVILLVKAERIQEARILVRSCFENAFYAAGLVSDGEKFLNEIIENDQKQRNSQGRLIYKEGLAVGDKFRQFMKENKGWEKSKTVDVKSVASKGAIQNA
jgi:hypothetical protein